MTEIDLTTQTADSTVLRPTVTLTHPMDPSFSVYGNAGTIERARRWAVENHYVLVEGLPTCAHGFYMMTACPGECHRNRWHDHVNIWAGESGRQPLPLLLAHPYAKKVPKDAQRYAECHGLDLDGFPQTWDDEFTTESWYSDSTVAVSFTLATSGHVLWPIELELIKLFAVSPFRRSWPDE